MKRRMSLLLAILMIVGVMCAAPVSVSANDEQAREISVYFENNWNWTGVFCHSWGSSLDTNTNWGSGVVEKVGKSVNGYDVYKAVVGSDAMGVIFAGIKDNGSGSEDQTPNIEEPDIFDGACYSMVWDEGNAVKISNIADVCPGFNEDSTDTSDTTEPTEVPSEEVSQPSVTDPTEGPSADTITVYFENNWKWEDSKIYWYGNQTGNVLEWPGVEMTYVETNADGNDIYSIEVPADIQGIVFSGGGEQSEDVLIGWFDGVCYYMLWDEESQTKNAVAYEYGPVNPDETEPTEEPTEPTEAPDETEPTEPTGGEVPSETYTVYYVDSGWLGNVYAYAWTDGKGSNDYWPGEAMVLTDIVSPDGSPVYSYTATTLYEYVIFSDGSDLQTEELIFTPDHYLWWTDECWYDDISKIESNDDDESEEDDVPSGTAILEGYTISLGGNIAINYFFTLSDDVANASDAKVVFTVPDTGSYYTREVLVEDAEYDGTYYIFTCEVASKEMTSVITTQFVSEVASTEVNEYTIKEYAETMLSNPDVFEMEQELVKALLNYGAAAQVYFDYNTDNLANDTECMTEADKVITAKDVSGFALEATGNTDSDYFYGVTLSLESETSLKLYLALGSVAQGTENISAYVNGEVTQAVRNGNLYELTIGNIPAHFLNETFTVEVGDITVRVSALSYVYLAQQSSKQTLADVANALAAYSDAAHNYSVG